MPTEKRAGNTQHRTCSASTYRAVPSLLAVRLPSRYPPPSHCSASALRASRLSAGERLRNNKNQESGRFRTEPITQTPASCRGCCFWSCRKLASGRGESLLLAGFPPSPERCRRRRFRRVDVENLYSSRLGRIRPATTGGSPPRSSPPGFAAWPTGACRPLTDIT